VWVDAAARTIAGYLPFSAKTIARKILFKSRHPGHLGLKGIGTIQDLNYWAADGRLDTLIPLQNYFSVFYPMLDTATSGRIIVFDGQGQLIGQKEFSVAHQATVQLHLSAILKEWHKEPTSIRYGTFICDIRVPASVKKALQASSPFYFIDRFYTAYLNHHGQPAFVHGIDKAFINPGSEKLKRWYPGNKCYTWVPEIPINIQEYERFTVIVCNRVGRSRVVRLVVEDTENRQREWEATVPFNGVKRFELTSENTSGLVPVELRMRLEGLPTEWGRALVFKEFSSGTISVMHC